MTIAMLYVSSPYAFVGADQVVSSGKIRAIREWVYPDGTVVPYPKVRIHPKLPVIWACAGPAKVPLRGQRAEVDSLIEEALSTSARQIQELGPILQFLEPLVQAEMELDPDPFREQADPGLTVLVGLSVDGAAGGAALHFGKASRAEGVADRDGRIAVSRDTASFVAAVNRSELHPPRGSSATQTAEHIRALLQRAVADARDRRGDDADVGGGIDIAMVGPAGATAV